MPKTLYIHIYRCRLRLPMFLVFASPEKTEKSVDFFFEFSIMLGKMNGMPTS